MRSTNKASCPFHLLLRLNRLFASISMESSSGTAPEVLHDLSPFFKIFKDGSIERLSGELKEPPCWDPTTQVNSKDVLYSSELNLTCRVYLPHMADPTRKLPLLVYFHGGAFLIESHISPTYHHHLNKLVAEANVVAVSVGYRLAPEHPIPTAYEDSWSALKWVAANGGGSEDWINSYADLSRVFLAGDSAGANICHHMMRRNSDEKLVGINIVGTVLVHPYFWSDEPLQNETTEPEKREVLADIWRVANPSSKGCNDLSINPHLDPKFGHLGCRKVLVIVAEKDLVRERGLHYYEKLKESGFGGAVDFFESKGENHCFHLPNWEGEKAVAMLKKISSFIRENGADEGVIRIMQG